VTDTLTVVEMVSTRAAQRGNGYGAALTATAALAAPDRPSALLASDVGRPVYERLGFVAVLRWTLWVGTR
jgi:predicted GNAT family acetyltransferase